MAGFRFKLETADGAPAEPSTPQDHRAQLGGGKRDSRRAAGRYGSSGSETTMPTSRRS